MEISEYNKLQQLYIIAKTYQVYVERDCNTAETAFIKSKKIINPDGSMPKLIYRIKDEATREAAGTEFGEIPENKRVQEEILTARKLLKIAETKLIEYTFSIVPVSISKEKRDILMGDTEYGKSLRQELIDSIILPYVNSLP